MRERLQEWGVYFFAVGLALWVAAGILLLVGNQPRERLIALFVIGAVSLALFALARPAEVIKVLTSRGSIYGFNALLISAGIIVIVGLVNFLGVRYHYRLDLTASKQFTLSPLTINVLKDLKQPVQALAFYTPPERQGQPDVEERLKQYAAQSDKFTYKFIDPQTDPLIANQYKVTYGTIVLVRGTRHENVFTANEQDLTNALVKVSEDTQPAIYFTTGHGEHSPNDSGQNGYSSLKSFLETTNYKVDTLNLKTVTDTLPSDISALVIAGPQQPFDPQEVQRVKDYLNKNGRALIMLDPKTQTGLEDLLKEWGLVLRNDVVVDPKFGLAGAGGQVLDITDYRSHAVTQDLSSFETVFPLVRSLTETSPAPTDRTVTPLFSSSDASWGQTDFAALQNQKAQFNASTDAKGPLDLAYAVEGTGEKPARLVVIGNSSFIDNGTLQTLFNIGLQQSGNGQLFANALHWLAGQENLIAIPPKQPDQHPMYLTNEQALFVFWSSFLMLPAAMLLVGGLVWWRRR
jgi:ABC-type uncharacterized transport system involved in gliding motility auxiliary subunit